MLARAVNRAISAVLILGVNAACASQPKESRSPESAERPATTAQPSPTSARESALQSARATPRADASSRGAKTIPEVIPAALALPLVHMEDDLGERIEISPAALAPVRERVKECEPGRTGVVRVRIVSGKDRTWMDVQPGTSLSGSTNRCVLETLSVVDMDHVLSRGAPQDRPSGFSSMMRIEW